MLLRRISRLPWGVAYVPKGPLLDWTDPAAVEQVISGIEAQARRSRAIFVKIDPDVSPEEPAGQALIALLNRRGWRFSAEQIQYRNTALLDLTPGEEALLENMKPKWRYNVRLAERRGVRIVARAVWTICARSMRFTPRPVNATDFWCGRLATTRLPGAHSCSPIAHRRHRLISCWPKWKVRPLPGSSSSCLAPTAWYMYGASSDRHRQLMPNHLLQWEAMRLAASQGCTRYDLWGAPDVLEESDPMWGVWRFKEGLGARFAPHIGAWDFPVSGPLYWSYTSAMPRVLDLMRSRHQTEIARRNTRRQTRFINGGFSMLKEFKEFILRGNVVDLAVAVIIGGAFGAIVTSLTNDIIMPLIGVLLGGIDFSGLTIQIGEATVAYGNFIQAVINFLIIGLVLFLVVKAMNKAATLGAKKEAAAPAAPPEDIKLLTEIRDLLQKQAK